jgi:MFS family permease
MPARISPGWILIVFSLINLLTYMDRGSIPGAPQEFSLFIHETLGVKVTDESKYLGALQSAFVGTYGFSVTLFGHLSHKIAAYKIATFGVSMWIVAMFLCGLAKHTDSFYLLIAARALSGMGEASFQCTVPSYIDDVAPPARKGVGSASSVVTFIICVLCTLRTQISL